MGCGVCEATCENDAVELTRNENKGIPLDVWELDSQQPTAVVEAVLPR